MVDTSCCFVFSLLNEAKNCLVDLSNTHKNNIQPFNVNTDGLRYIKTAAAIVK